jgi:5-methylcytosine-specific restriction endonuclease McrA
MRDDVEGQHRVLDAKQLSDDELIVRLKRCVARDRQLTAQLLEHFGEVSARGLYRDQGYPSMFHYAVHALHMSEPEAGLRIRVSRLGREFPEALRMLARGELHMTALRLLAPVLTRDNVGLLHEARFKTKQQVLELRAKHFPEPDAPARNRKLPGRTAASNARAAVCRSGPSELAKASSHRGEVADAPQSAGVEPAPGSSLVRAESRNSDARATSVRYVDRAPSFVGPVRCLEDASQNDGEHNELAVAGEAAQLPTTPSRADATVEFRLESPEPAVAIPLSEGRYMVQFTADQQLQDKLIQAQELMRHENPRGDFVAVFERALDLLIADRKKKLFGLRTSSRSRRTATPVAKAEGASANDAVQTPAAAVAAEEASVRPDELNGLHPLELDVASTERMRDSEARAQRENQRSRYIPRAVRREVMARDGYQCTFMGPEGTRCPERGRLQLDHHPVPAGCDGPSTTDNLRVCCAVHNLLAAEHFYGRDMVLQKIAATRVEVSVSKRDASCGPERAASDVGPARLETMRTLQADPLSLRKCESTDGSSRNARSSA